MNRLPFVPGAEGTPFGKTFANAEGVRAGFGQMQGALAAELDAELLEMIRLRVASNNGCDY